MKVSCLRIRRRRPNLGNGLKLGEIEKKENEENRPQGMTELDGERWRGTHLKE